MNCAVAGYPLGGLALRQRLEPSIKQVEELGLDQAKPFGRRGDIFGISIIDPESSFGAKQNETALETVYWLRLTKRMTLGRISKYQTIPLMQTNFIRLHCWA